VTPRGASGVRRASTPATIALAFWRVASVSGSDVELRGIEGCADPIAYDDQYNNYYLQKTDGTYTQITDTVQSTQKVTVASAASISTDQWLRIVRTSGGDDLVTLSRPTATAPLNRSTILTLSSRTDRTNWATNPIVATWSAGAPVSWTETDTSGYMTVSEDTSRYYFGARSAKMTFVAPGGVLANARLTTATKVVPPSATSRTFVASAWVYADNAATSFSNTPTIRLSLGGTNTDTSWASLTANAWNRLEVSATTTGASIAAYVEIRMGSSAAATIVINLGGMLIEELSSPQTSMVIGSDPAFALAAANRWLGIYASPPTAYQVNFADLGAWDAAAFPYDIVTLGAMANVRDTDLDLTASYRIVEITRDHRNPLASRITVSTRTPDLITSLTGIADL
jgi:hypothetical protein